MSQKEPVELTTPKTNKYGWVVLRIEVKPEMYRDLKRASDKMFSKPDMAATCRAFLKKGIMELVPQKERES